MMQQNIVAFGGPDRCGKTEISSELAKIMGVPRFKASDEHDTYLNHQDKFIQQLRYSDTRMVDFLMQTGYSVILDRAWCCEYAYSQVLDRETDMDMLRLVDSSMAAMNAKVIICYRSDYIGIVDDLDPTIESHRLNELHDAYFEFAKWTKCKTYKLCVDDENLQREINEVLEFLKTS